MLQRVVAKSVGFAVLGMFFLHREAAHGERAGRSRAVGFGAARE